MNSIFDSKHDIQNACQSVLFITTQLKLMRRRICWMSFHYGFFMSTSRPTARFGLLDKSCF